MNHTCSKCGNVFPIVRATRSELAWGMGLRGIYTTNYSRAIDEYVVVVCPKCGHRESDEHLKFFGILTPSQFKVAICVSVLIALAVTLMTT